MITYIQDLFSRLVSYIYDLCPWKSKSEPEQSTFLDARETVIYEKYMADKEMRELNEIICFIKRKENDIKNKCKLR